ncbi:FHA domain-containing protein [Marinobacterium aestuariivivens]|uniref:FHA domain-containing protein n=1 Tax=Marinobacterium aestuariivivens TaxID=1698799 RepID=A0ABW2A6C1_9GAMM
MNNNEGDDSSPAPADAAAGGWSLVSEHLPQGSLSLSGALVIGRGTECDLVIDDPHLSRRHATIRVSETGLQVEDLGSANGTYLNDTRIEAGEAHPGDEIRLDRLAFKVLGPVTADLETTRLRDPEATALHVADSTALLQAGGEAEEGTRLLGAPAAWLEGAGVERFALEPGLIRIGRAPDNDLVLDDPSVSSRHAELGFQHGQWTLTDLQSTNGSYVGDEAAESSPLSSGDRLRFGKVEMQFKQDMPGRSGDASSRTVTGFGAGRRRRGLRLLLGLVLLAACAAVVLLLLQRPA